MLNGFDFDELYNLSDDPLEMRNLAEDPGYEKVIRRMMLRIWERITETGDRTLAQSHYPGLRIARVGPLTGERDGI